MWICDFENFQFEFCFMPAFTDEFRSFVDCRVLVGFGDCKFFFQTQMALLHSAMVWGRLADDISCDIGGISFDLWQTSVLSKCCSVPFFF